MKKTLLALALLASAATAFATDGTKPGPGKPAAKRADHCTGAAAVKCDKDMAAAKSDKDMANLPACCRAKMAAAKAAEAKPTATAKASL